MAYNIFTNQDPDGVIVPGGAQTQQRQRRVPGMDVANRIVQQYQAQQSQQQPVQQAAAPQTGSGSNWSMPVVGSAPASTWHGKDTTAPDGGIYSWMGRTFTTPQQEQQYRKQSRARMGIMAVADALRHLGNIYHTTQYAPSQQFNKPVEQEYAMYKANKAERDKDNYAIYQQQLAQAKWEAEQAHRDWQRDIGNANLKLKVDAAERAKDKAKQDQENWLKTFEANQGWREYQKERQTKMDDHRIENDKANLDIRRQNLSISWARLQETRAQHAWTRQNSGGGGAAAAGKQKVFFSGKYGDVSRSQNLTLDEGVSMVKQMRDMGWVTPQKYNEYMSALNNGDAGSLDALLNGRVSTGGKGATGGIIQAALQYHPEAATWLNKHYGFVVQEVRKPKAAAPQKPAAPKPAPQKPAAKDTTTVKASSSTQAAAQKATAPQKPAATPQKQAAGGQKATQNGGSTSKKASTPSKAATPTKATKATTPTKKPEEKKRKKGDYSAFSIHNK